MIKARGVTRMTEVTGMASNEVTRTTCQVIKVNNTSRFTGLLEYIISTRRETSENDTFRSFLRVSRRCALLGALNCALSYSIVSNEA